MDQTRVFEAERPRLLRIATHVLGDAAEAEDVVQTAWLRLHRTDTAIDNLPGWLTTVTTRLCLDRLRARLPVPVDDRTVEAAASSSGGASGGAGHAGEDPAEHVVLADTVGVALQVVLDRLTPGERVAFVLHDSFGVDFPTIAEVLGNSPAASRKLASRARGKVAQPVEPDQHADWAVVDAFLAAAREGDFDRLLRLLAPGAVVLGDGAAVALGTPTRVEGRRPVAELFNGAAKAALSVFLDGRPAAAWFHRGEPRVVFDFTLEGGVVQRIDFRADPEVLSQVVRRQGAARAGD